LNPARRAVVVVANDAFIDFFIPFLESFREYNPDMRLIVVPFDDSLHLVRLLAPIYDFEIYEGSFAEVDRLSDTLFGVNDRLRRRMRKLAAFDMDLDEFFYMDTDILVSMDVGPVFGHTLDSQVDLVFVADGGGWVYKQGSPRLAGSEGSPLFATPLFVSSRRAGSVADISASVVPLKETFLAMRAEPLFDQPLLNFYFDVAGKTARGARDLAIDLVYCDASFASTSDIELRDGKAIHGGRTVTLCHWSGPQKFDEDLRLSELLFPYVVRARKRLSGIEEFADWLPFRRAPDIRRKIVREAKRIAQQANRLMMRGWAASGLGRKTSSGGGDKFGSAIESALKDWSSEAQLSGMQAEIIGSLIAFRNFSANVLVFGAGHDTPYWVALNSAGRTMVVEDDALRAEKIRRKVKSDVLVSHRYPTTVLETAMPDPKVLAGYPPPPGMTETSWDIILIDGPAGYTPDSPGRALPIYWAYKYSNARTHIFVDDYDRPLERTHCDFFFAKEGRTTVLPSHGEVRMFWRIGRGLPANA